MTQDPMVAPKIWKMIVPFVATAAIFAWFFRGLDWQSLQDALQKIELWVCFAGILGFGLVSLGADYLSFGYAYRAYIVRGIAWKEVLSLRGGMLLLQVILPQLAEVLPPVFFFRRFKIPPLQTVMAVLPVLLSDTTANLLVLTFGILWSGVNLGMSWMGLILIAWTIVTAALVRWFFKGNRDHWSLLLFFLLMRLMPVLVNVWIVWLLLQGIGVSMPFSQTMVVAPLLMLGAMLPISAGGYGGPQGVAVYILVTTLQCATMEIALAFSLLWSSLFAFGRLLAGIGFLAPAWRMLKLVKQSEGAIS